VTDKLIGIQDRYPALHRREFRHRQDRLTDTLFNLVLDADADELVRSLDEDRAQVLIWGPVNAELSNQGDLKRKPLISPSPCSA
jgi:hypothetical protein